MSQSLAVAEKTAQQDPLPGIYGDIPEDDYHASPGVSVSRLKRFRDLPAKAHISLPDSPTLRFGSLTHLAILQPHLVDKVYFPVPLKAINRETKTFAEWQEKAGKREVVRQTDFDKAMRIRDSVWSHQVGRDLLSAGASFEQSFYWRDWETGMLLRGRADIVRPDWGVLADIKTTDDASEDAFSATISRYAYDWQAVMYQDGYELAQVQERAAPLVLKRVWRPETMIFLPVEKEEPYLCHPIEVDPVELGESREELRDTIRRYKQCVDANHFPGYPSTLTRVGVKPWARRERANVPEYHSPYHQEDAQ